MKVVTNTTPIISLASIGRLDLLDEMIAKGRWYSPTVYRSFLTRIGEL